MMTFTYNASRVTIKAGKVIESNCESFPVGTKIAATRFRDMGWNRVKKVVQWDAFGRRIG